MIIEYKQNIFDWFQFITRAYVKFIKNILIIIVIKSDTQSSAGESDWHTITKATQNER